jgi:hypothetical protein
LLSPFGFAEQFAMESKVNVLTFNNLFNKKDKKYSGNITLDETGFIRRRKTAEYIRNH